MQPSNLSDDEQVMLPQERKMSSSCTKRSPPKSKKGSSTLKSADKNSDSTLFDNSLVPSRLAS